jgi:hypothetical protein
VIEGSVIEDVVAQQRPILHQPEHDGPPRAFICCRCETAVAAANGGRKVTRVRR